jgi:hypothetical protein
LDVELVARRSSAGGQVTVDGQNRGDLPDRHATLHAHPRHYPWTWAFSIRTLEAHMRLITAVMALGMLSAAESAHGQGSDAGQAGPRAVLPAAQEIALARSAAPAAVSDSARVLVWNGTDFDIAVEGSSGVSCYVARSWPDSIEPHCFDAEGSRTILQVHLMQMKLRHQGKSTEQINAAVAEGLRSGTLQLPGRPVMSYMMSAGQQLIGDDGRSVGSWRPHLMIYYPYLTQESLGLGSTPSTDAAVVVDPGTPLANIMVVVREFVAVRTETASPR